MIRVSLAWPRPFATITAWAERKGAGGRKIEGLVTLNGMQLMYYFDVLRNLACDLVCEKSIHIDSHMAMCKEQCYIVCLKY